MTAENDPPFDHSGSSFESFLEEEGILDEVRAVAIARVRAWQQARVQEPAEQ